MTIWSTSNCLLKIHKNHENSRKSRKFDKIAKIRENHENRENSRKSRKIFANIGTAIINRKRKKKKEKKERTKTNTHNQTCASKSANRLNCLWHLTQTNAVIASNFFRLEGIFWTELTTLQTNHCTSKRSCQHTQHKPATTKTKSK